MSVSTELFRSVLGRLAGGVAVVTSRTAEGAPRGLTATAVCSVSLSPPLVLVCMEDGTRTRAAIRDSGVYAVNLLSSERIDLAERFALDLPEKFDGLALGRAATGAPLLAGSAAYCDCRVEKTVPAGDHTIFVGRVEAAGVRPPDDGESRPLVRWAGRYLTVAPPVVEATGGRDG